ncbi:hypothetical protein [Nocardioides mangrovicus]|nr:hypothetical protein [Nocardioides mangrovicus]
MDSWAEGGEADVLVLCRTSPNPLRQEFVETAAAVARDSYPHGAGALHVGGVFRTTEGFVIDLDARADEAALRWFLQTLHKQLLVQDPSATLASMPAVLPDALRPDGFTSSVSAIFCVRGWRDQPGLARVTPGWITEPRLGEQLLDQFLPWLHDLPTASFYWEAAGTRLPIDEAWSRKALERQITSLPGEAGLLVCSSGEVARRVHFDVTGRVICDTVDPNRDLAGSLAEFAAQCAHLAPILEYACVRRCLMPYSQAVGVLTSPPQGLPPPPPGRHRPTGYLTNQRYLDRSWVPDVAASQMLTAEHVARLDLEPHEWATRRLSDQRYLVSSTSPESWDPPSESLLHQARRDFAGLIIGDEPVREVQTPY